VKTIVVHAPHLLLIAISATFLTVTAGCNSKSAMRTTSETRPSPQAATNLYHQRQEAEKQVRPEIENERNSEEEKARKELSEEAITAVADTRKAIDAIAAGDQKKALSEIEDATGKLEILLARNPGDALMPVSTSVEVIDAAPQNDKAVKLLISGAESAVKLRDFPRARVLLYDLISEIRQRTYNLPLATYPGALKDAARLLDAGKNEQASQTLLTALNTLVIVDRITPIPLILARASVTGAQQKQHSDPQTAQTLLEAAKNELKRCAELGYAAQAPEYASLNKEIDNIENGLKGHKNTTSFFDRLRSDLESFINKQSRQQHR
jgi:YfdX protein